MVVSIFPYLEWSITRILARILLIIIKGNNLPSLDDTHPLLLSLLRGKSKGETFPLSDLYPSLSLNLSSDGSIPSLSCTPFHPIKGKFKRDSPLGFCINRASRRLFDHLWASSLLDITFSSSPASSTAFCTLHSVRSPLHPATWTLQV